jgi:hypothetical protein
MICPQCQTKYPEGNSSCPDCQVALRSNLSIAEEIVAKSAPGDALVPLWDGADLAFHAALLDELESVGIPFFDSSSATLPTQENLSHVFGATRPGLVYQVAVLASQLESAEKLVQKVETMNLPDFSLPEGVEVFASTEPAAVEDFAEPEKIEVWTGTDLERSQFLIDALHENNISLWLQQSVDGNHLHVAATDESRAREIVREVIEAMPPE